MKYFYLIFYLGLLSSCYSQKEESKYYPKVLSNLQKKALADYFVFDYTFQDTVLSYSITSDSLILDFNEPNYDSWHVTVSWHSSTKKHACYCPSGKLYKLDNDNKLSFALPTDCNIGDLKDQTLVIEAAPKNSTFLSKYMRSKSNVQLITYTDIGDNLLKPVGAHASVVKHINTKVNVMSFVNYPLEIMDFLNAKRWEIAETPDYFIIEEDFSNQMQNPYR